MSYGAASDRSLAETVAWCRSRASADDPKRCLRSEELHPTLLARNRVEVVDGVLHRRSQLLSLRPPKGEPLGSSAGRLLVYFPDANLCDGAAMEASSGFFDADNTPPWDTWVGLVSTMNREHDASFATALVCWVPEVLTADANAGVQVNPEGCILWLDEVYAQGWISPDALPFARPR